MSDRVDDGLRLRGELIAARPKALRPGTHYCPARRCARHVRDHKLMCPPHWRMVPVPLARAVYRAWQGGAGMGSTALLRAQIDAIKAVDAQLDPEGRRLP